MVTLKSLPSIAHTVVAARLARGPFPPPGAALDCPAPSASETANTVIIAPDGRFVLFMITSSNSFTL
jgi:hypothetical protein